MSSNLNYCCDDSDHCDDLNDSSNTIMIMNANITRTTTLNSMSSYKSNKSVTFHLIQIRQYQWSIGDNPSVSSGPALSLSWNYFPERTIEIPLEEYESKRPLRRNRIQMIIPRTTREDILKYECGLSNAEIANSVKDILTIKDGRLNSIRRSQRKPKLETCKSMFRRIMITSRMK